MIWFICAISIVLLLVDALLVVALWKIAQLFDDALHHSPPPPVGAQLYDSFGPLFTTRDYQLPVEEPTPPQQPLTVVSDFGIQPKGVPACQEPNTPMILPSTEPENPVQPGEPIISPPSPEMSPLNPNAEASM